MKIKNLLWVLFILIAVVFIGLNIFHIISVYGGSNQQSNEDDHAHEDVFDDFEVIQVDFNGISADTFKNEIQSTFFGANTFGQLITNNTICKNNENGDIYWYSDTNKCIYRLSNGKTEALVNKPAVSLMIHNNSLYFISPEEPYIFEGLPTGEVWKYDLSTGELITFLEIQTSSICVVNNQIYCITIDDMGITSNKVFDNGSFEEFDFICCGSYMNYVLAYQLNVEGYLTPYLIDFEANETIPLLSNDVYISEQCIYKDKLYYRYFVGIDETNDNYGNICSLNLLTGEKKVYDLVNTIGHTHELSYNFTNNKLYLLSESAVAIIDLSTDEIMKQNIQGHEHSEENHNHSIYNRLFSDGKTIYIIDDSDGEEQLISFDEFITKMSVS